MEDVGGAVYLAELWDAAPTAANAEYYARIVRDKALVRGLIHASTEILRDAYDQGQPADELLESAERKILDIAQMGIVGHVKATLVRLPHVLLLVTWHYAMMNAFGVAVPPLVALALLPAMFFATALPISVQGVGPTQYVAVLFFSRYSPQGSAGVLAYSLGTMSISVLLQAAMGLAFLAAGRKLGVPEHPIEEVEREAEEDELGQAQRASIGNGGGTVGDGSDLSQASGQT